MQVQRVCPGFAELVFDDALERSEFASYSHARSKRRDSSVYICSTMTWPNIARRSNRTFALICLASRLRTPHFSRWIKDKDWQQFKSVGYMVIRDVIPTRLTTKAALDIAAFIGADIRDSTTWYRGPVENDGMVALHHAQSLWNIRQYPSTASGI